MLTQKQENFCSNIVLSGMTQHDAYIGAYNTGKMLAATIDRNAFTLTADNKIATRIKELRAEVKSDLVASEIERKEILSEILRGKLSQFSDGAGVIDRSKLDSHAIQAIEQLEVMGRKATVLKVKLHNPIQAIAELNKMEGVYSEPNEPDKIVQNFVFILPDGTRVLPGEMRKGLTDGNHDREGD